MQLEVGHGRTSLTRLILHHTDCVFIGLNYQPEWDPAFIGVRQFGDRRALKIEFDRRSLYRGSDGAFYVIKALDADQVTYGDLVLTRVGVSECEEML